MRLRILIMLFSLIVLFAFFGGCSKEIKGPERVNVPPTVKFVNIPVERARFSTDTTLYWIGNDIDGFIKMYRYVVLDSSVVVDPEAFLGQDRTGFSGDTSQVTWNNIEVTLNSTGTNAQVRMSADISDPVRKYVASYVFLQAIDNIGAKSEIVYRSYLKNNHFPNTQIGVNDINEPYINAKGPGGILEGITMSFSGVDPIDHRLGDEPPFEYRWKLFGPFTDLELNSIKKSYLDSVFMDNYGDLYRVNETLKVYIGLDTIVNTGVNPPDTTYDSLFNRIAVRTIRGTNQFGAWNYHTYGIDHYLDSMVIGPDRYSVLDTLTIFEGMEVDSSGFSYATSATVYDAFRYQQVSGDGDTTRHMNFVVWSQCRDDARTPDKIPNYAYFSVIEPKFERDVMVVDASQYTSANYPVQPYRYPWRQYFLPGFADSFMVRNVYGKYINNWKPDSFDATNILPNVRRQRIASRVPDSVTLRYDVAGCTEDYYNFPIVNSSGSVAGIILREILKHKIVIWVKDEVDYSIDIESNEGSFIIDGLNAGISCMVMARAPGGTNYIELDGVPLISELYTTYFAVDEFHSSAWYTSELESWGRWILGTEGDNGWPLTEGFSFRTEDFIGAGAIENPNLGLNLPDLLIDYDYLENRYLWDTIGPDSYYPLRAPLALDTILGDPIPLRPKDFHGKYVVGPPPDSGYAALPEVGFIVRTLGRSEPLYLYMSLYGPDGPGLDRPGELRNNEGKVVAIRHESETGIFRTALFGFTLLAFDETTAQDMFNQMLDWLSDQPYIQTGKPRATGKFTTGNDFERYRAIAKRLHELRQQGLLNSN